MEKEKETYTKDEVLHIVNVKFFTGMFAGVGALGLVFGLFYAFKK